MKKINEHSLKAERLANKVDGDTFYLSVINGKIFAEGIYTWDEEEQRAEETLHEINPEILKMLNKALREDSSISEGTGLAEFVKREYRNDFESILFDHIYVCGENGEIATTFKIEFNWLDPEHYFEDIVDYAGKFLIGQCADGWGEGFEQRPFCEEAEEYCDMVGDLFFSPWTSDSRWIPEIEMTVNEGKDEEYFGESSISTFRKKLSERNQFSRDIKNLLNN